MSRIHKSNFSVPTLRDAQSAVIFGSLRNSEGTHPYSGSSSSSAVAPWMALEISKSSEEVRNSQGPPISLKLKMPTFKGLGKTRSLSSEGQRTPTLMSQPRCNDTLALDPVRFKNVDPHDTSSRAPTDLCSYEESAPNVPCTTRFNLVHSQPSTQSCPDVRDLKSDNPPDSGDSKSLVDNNIKSRNPPSISQDDLSFHVQTVDKNRRSIKRKSRRASLSVDSMLSPSAPLQTSSQISQSNSGQNDTQHFTSSVATLTDSGYTTGISPVSPLSPITFKSIPSSQLDPARIPVAELVKSPSLPTSKDSEESASSSVPSSHTEMSLDALSANSTCVSSNRTSSQPHSSLQDQSSSVPKISHTATPELPSATPAQIRVSPRVLHNQAQKWEEEEEILTNEIAEGNYEDTCITRFEQEWMGFWNRGAMTLVIDDLRELRTPKLSV